MDWLALLLGLTSSTMGGVSNSFSQAINVINANLAQLYQFFSTSITNLINNSSLILNTLTQNLYSLMSSLLQQLNLTMQQLYVALYTQLSAIVANVQAGITALAVAFQDSISYVSHAVTQLNYGIQGVLNAIHAFLPTLETLFLNTFNLFPAFLLSFLQPDYTVLKDIIINLFKLQQEVLSEVAEQWRT